MCRCCSYQCCSKSKPEECGCDSCTNPLCWTDEQWLAWNDAGEPDPTLWVARQLELFEEKAP